MADKVDGGATARRRLPELVVIGAMKCATSAVHAYLDGHPEVRMSTPKELNFFNGPEVPPHDDATSWWRTGQWHRGVDWYATQFDPDAVVAGEASPAYTSPSCPEVAPRMAAVLPDVRLVYLVRDPVDRAVSQYRHHRRDGTERRSMEAAILDPASQYLDRSSYFARLEPFLRVFAPDQIRVVVQERLLRHRRRELDALYAHVGAAPWWDEELHTPLHHVGTSAGRVDGPLRRQVEELLAADRQRLEELIADEIDEWNEGR
ncbi:MAG TPA: sulfotransferase [Marmoricola sp.]|nr:sulfotransferase [Marmoricola sp.]